eukprot:6480045-Amphidinium_carterae.1
MPCGRGEIDGLAWTPSRQQARQPCRPLHLDCHSCLTFDMTCPCTARVLQPLLSEKSTVQLAFVGVLSKTLLCLFYLDQLTPTQSGRRLKVEHLICFRAFGTNLTHQSMQQPGAPSLLPCVPSPSFSSCGRPTQWTHFNNV